MKVVFKYIFMTCLFLVIGMKFSYSNTLSIKKLNKHSFTLHLNNTLKSSNHFISEDLQIENSFFVEFELTDSEEEEEEKVNELNNLQFFYLIDSQKLVIALSEVLNNKTAYNSTFQEITNLNWYLPYSKYIGFI